MYSRVSAWTSGRRAFQRVGRAASVLALLAGTSCSTLNSVKDTFLGGGQGSGEPQRLTGFIGAAVADEPRAALAGREVLALGGSAADAAVAMGFTLAVTLPSRAGLGGGGACLAYNPSRDGPGAGNPEAVLFLPSAAPTPVPGTDRPAAIPMLARGLFALQTRYGRLSFETLITPAEQLARFGTPISRALLQDLAVVAGPLLRDPNARAVFGPQGTPLTEGATLSQPDLSGTLAQIRTAGVGDLYQGALARRLEQASRLAGGGLTTADMRPALPRVGAPVVVPSGRDQVAFLPATADGGQGAAGAFQALLANPSDLAGARARTLGGGARSLPASASFAALDREGNSVFCAVTMNNLFGTGRVAPGTGILLAAAPRPGAAPLLAAALAWNPNLRGFRAGVAGSGQEGAALAVAVGMINALGSNAAMPLPVPDPGRANAIACSRYLPDNEGTCSWAADPRGAGLAAAGN